MPELAEVEFFRKQWDAGRKKRIVSVRLNPGKRIFRDVKTKSLQEILTGATLLDSQAHGKQMLFRFSKNAWLGLHLGMTGKLLSLPAGPAPFVPSKHDHLVFRQAGQSLIFSDPRQFGRVRFHVGRDVPPWWRGLPPALLSKQFTPSLVETFLARHRAAPIKAVLLMQAGFPGIGNWMADEILWQAGVHPLRPAGKLLPAEIQKVHRLIKSVSRTAMKTVGVDYGDLPATWLFDRRWKRGGQCPKDSAPLRHATIGGRTTCWCPVCQSPNISAA
jgi:formamidopyrimidine-DNA glycosylase